MFRIRGWLISKLGGVTIEQQEETRSNYESWAVENLTGKNGEIVTDCRFYFPYYEDSIVVIRSRIEICNGKIKDLKVAPWCRDVVINSVSSSN